MTTDTELFIQIADVLQRHLPEHWIKAYLQIELEAHSERSACFYQTANEPAYQHVDVQVDVVHSFKELHKSMMRRQDQLWNCATYILSPDGHFDIHFEYQDFAVSTALDRRKAWRKKFLC
jgi:hypothetical protein